MSVNLYKAHPWHGVKVGDDAPKVVNAYIEIVPTDTVKYETDKESGLLRVDRPQKYSNCCPTLYGFIPQTLCGAKVGQYASQISGTLDIKGDNDPLDICVLTERSISHGDVLVSAIPIGGIRMIDRSEADDKIIAVLKDDALYGGLKDIQDLPKSVVDRISHYFLTYKNIPGAGANVVRLDGVYGKDEAQKIIELSCADYVSLLS
jgi:inorganic pyrophosphatase